MTPDLSRRVALAFNAGKPWPEDRARILAACQKANSFANLPARIQQLITSLTRGKSGILDESES